MISEPFFLPQMFVCRERRPNTYDVCEQQAGYLQLISDVLRVSVPLVHCGVNRQIFRCWGGRSGLVTD